MESFGSDDVIFASWNKRNNLQGEPWKVVLV